jgi:phosphate/sulfate permease
MNFMICVKSILAGALAVFLGVPTIAVTLIIGVGIFYRPHGTSNAVSWDSRSLIGTWPFNWVFWLPIAFLFAIGFFWEFRRASH